MYGKENTVPTKVVKHVLEAVSKDTTRPNICGLIVLHDGEGAVCGLAATDGHCAIVALPRDRDSIGEAEPQDTVEAFRAAWSTGPHYAKKPAFVKALLTETGRQPVPGEALASVAAVDVPAPNIREVLKLAPIADREERTVFGVNAHVLAKLSSAKSLQPQLFGMRFYPSSTPLAPFAATYHAEGWDFLFVGMPMRI